MQFSPFSCLYYIKLHTNSRQNYSRLGKNAYIINPATQSQRTTCIGTPRRWHRLGFSIKGDAATLILDCKKQITKELVRQATSKISTTGIILIGQQLLDDILYTVSNTGTQPTDSGSLWVCCDGNSLLVIYLIINHVFLQRLLMQQISVIVLFHSLSEKCKHPLSVCNSHFNFSHSFLHFRTRQKQKLIA
jgi:hypothetical protein